MKSLTDTGRFIYSFIAYHSSANRNKTTSHLRCFRLLWKGIQFDAVLPNFGVSLSEYLRLGLCTGTVHLPLPDPVSWVASDVPCLSCRLAVSILTAAAPVPSDYSIGHNSSNEYGIYAIALITTVERHVFTGGTGLLAMKTLSQLKLHSNKYPVATPDIFNG